MPSVRYIALLLCVVMLSGCVSTKQREGHAAVTVISTSDPDAQGRVIATVDGKSTGYLLRQKTVYVLPGEHVFEQASSCSGCGVPRWLKFKVEAGYRYLLPAQPTHIIIRDLNDGLIGHLRNLHGDIYE